MELSGFSIVSDIESDGPVCANYARGDFIYTHQPNGGFAEDDPYDDEEEMY